MAGGRHAGRALAFVLAALALCLLVAPTAFADTFVVTRRGDPVPGACKKSDCSLREAVRAANAHPGSDKVVLPSTKPYTLARTGMPEDGAQSGDLDVTNDPLRIVHSGPGRATIDAKGIDRVFEIFVGAPTHLEKLRITGGDFPSSNSGDGGGIRTSANLWLVHSVLTDNHARGANGAGGGLQALDGKLWILESTISRNVAADSSGALDVGNHGVVVKNSTITRNRAVFAGVGYFYGDGETTIGASTVSGNRSTGDTGGIYFSESAGTLFIDRSTFSGNVAATDGGGLSARNGEVKIVNSTFAGNKAGGDGGGLWAFVEVQLNAVTIARNLADSDNAGGGVGAGILVVPSVGADVRVRNTIVALNRFGGGAANECAGDPVTSLGHNMLVTRGPMDACSGFEAPSDRVGGHLRLGKLMRNGGATKTIALRKGSAAINKADASTAPGRDQRGVKRRDPDVGAFERR
ncbi:MAG TPA: right-handed parallel beta-helix repeat-containing protein [Gaiellaceae bacterium]|nr:right-handed parallel beta-helix repeat-containing protein [Gaiellaceae bacterium]